MAASQRNNGLKQSIPNWFPLFKVMEALEFRIFMSEIQSQLLYVCGLPDGPGDRSCTALTLLKSAFTKTEVSLKVRAGSSCCKTLANVVFFKKVVKLLYMIFAFYFKSGYVKSLKSVLSSRAEQPEKSKKQMPFHDFVHCTALGT